MARSKNPVLPDHVIRFRAYVEKWQILLGLQNWRFAVVHKPRMSNMAETTPDVNSFTAGVFIGRDFGHEEVNDATLESTAIHELCHVLVAPLKAAVASKDMSDDEKYAVEEALVNNLEKLLFDKYYDRVLFQKEKI